MTIDTEEMDPDPWEQLSRQEKEEYQWEQHKRDLEELKRRRAECAKTAIRVNRFFQQLGAKNVSKNK